ncbi:MAG: phage virion morphogenesis protein [Alphaproteobacteria bacterium]
MSGVKLHFELDARPVQAALNALVKAGEDLAPLMDLIGNYLGTGTRHRFETGAAPDGTAWKTSRRALEEGGKTLVDKGHLRGSITHRAGRDFVEVGSNLIYAAVQQFGATIRAKAGGKLIFRVGGGYRAMDEVTIPARPWLGLSAADPVEITEIVNAYLKTAGGLA